MHAVDEDLRHAWCAPPARSTISSRFEPCPRARRYSRRRRPSCSSSALRPRAIAAEHRRIDLDPSHDRTRLRLVHLGIARRGQVSSRTVRAKVSTSTAPRPARSSTRAHSSTVAPVVKTSSIRTTRLPRDVGAAALQREGAGDVAAARRRRCACLATACAGGAPASRRRPAARRRAASACASTAAWL